MKRPTLLAAYTLAEAHGTGGFKGWVELHSGWVTVEVCFDCLSLSTENNIDFWGNTFRKKTFLKFTIIRIVLMITKPSRPLCAFQVTCVSPMWDGIHSHHNRDVDIYIRTSTGSDQVLVTVRRASPAYSRLQTCSLSHPPPPCWLSSLRSLPLCLSYCIPDR